MFVSIHNLGLYGALHPAEGDLQLPCTDKISSPLSLKLDGELFKMHLDEALFRPPCVLLSCSLLGEMCGSRDNVC